MLIDRKKPDSPANLILLLFGGFVIMTLLGFAKPRSFLYLAPFVVVLQILFLNRQAAPRLLLQATLLLLPSIGVTASLYHPPAPFKRENAIPFASVMDFVAGNERSPSLIITSDNVVARALAGEGRCVSMFFTNPACFRADARYSAIFLIYGHSFRSGAPGAGSQILPENLRTGIGRSNMVAARADMLTTWLSPRPAAVAHFGEDTDAVLKSRLTGTKLDSWLLQVDLYYPAEPPGMFTAPPAR